MSDKFSKDESTFSYKVTKNMEELRVVQLDLLEKFMEVCNRHQLRYFSIYGTLLGAIRHQGFIPWDDDIDIAMPRNDYEKLRTIVSKEFEYPYFFQTPENDPENFTAGTSRLRNSNTTHIEYINIGHACNNGIPIDIVPLDGVFSDKRLQRRQIKKIEFYKTMLYAKTYGHDHEEFFDYSKIRWKSFSVLSKFLTHSWLFRKFEQACSVHDYEDAELVGVFAQKTGNESKYWFKNDFEKTIKVKFENVMIPVPIGYKRCLATVWGNYMELPPLNERKPMHTGIIDTETSYKDYDVSNYTDIFKNIVGKRIFLFGAGMMFDHYMKKEGRKYPPEYVFDNDEKKWGTRRNGILIKSPQELKTYVDENTRIVIANIYYKEIIEQLRELGIKEYYIYFQGRKYRSN